jgi:FkbM family methyltransferase
MSSKKLSVRVISITFLLKLLYRLNTYLNTIEVGHFNLGHRLNVIINRYIIKMLAPGNTLLIKIEDIPMYIHGGTAEFWMYAFRPYEPYTIQLFKQAIKAGAIVLDIGAQFGYFSLTAAKRVGAGGKVYAIEPVPSNLELLKRNIQINGYTHIIHPVQKAIGNISTTVKLFIHENSDSHSMYRDPNVSVKEEFSVECITIDEFLGGQPVNVIKLDIEGNEPYALEGMKQTIENSPDLILFAEFAPVHLRRAGVEPKDYLDQIKQLGFDLWLINEQSRCLEPVINYFVREDNPSWYANLYCRKRGLRNL